MISNTIPVSAATAVLMAGMAIGSPIAQLENAVMAANGTHLVNNFNNGDCKFKEGNNNFYPVKDGSCVSLAASPDACSLHVQPSFDHSGFNDGLTCHMQFFYENDKCEGKPGFEYTDGTIPDEAKATPDGFCADALELHSDHCPKSYNLKCAPYAGISDEEYQKQVYWNKTRIATWNARKPVVGDLPAKMQELSDIQLQVELMKDAGAEKLEADKRAAEDAVKGTPAEDKEAEEKKIEDAVEELEFINSLFPPEAWEDDDE